MMSTALEQEIDEKIGEVRTDSIDLSIGEIATLHGNQELIIQPEYQRLYRWTPEQSSRLIESVLLELPIPQIFVMENSDGVFELIDGLQRVSTALQFIEPSIINSEPLRLNGCDIVTGLNGKVYADLPMSLRLRLKRSAFRTVVIKRQSKSFLRYEMFKRLNTGGADLAPQEIRNCSARMIGDSGASFYEFLRELSADTNFAQTTSTLSQADYEQKQNEELVLRFLATKNFRGEFRGSVRDWLDDYMESILLGFSEFDYATEEKVFRSTFQLANEKLRETAFVKFRGVNPVGGLAPAYFEAISVGIFIESDRVAALPAEQVRSRLTTLVQSQDFRDVTGPGANSRTKLERRIDLVRGALQAA